MKIHQDRTLIIGDIHGSLESLNGVLEMAKYNPKQDRLICLGDYVDGWEHSYEVVDMLIDCQENSSFDNIYLMGNHDKYFFDVLDDGLDQFRDRQHTETINAEWWQQDGESTFLSYINHSDSNIIRHKNLFYDKLHYYYIEDNRLYVHAGFNHRLGLRATYRIDKNELLWNRLLYQGANQNKDRSVLYGNYETIFIGHTSSAAYGFYSPHRACNVLNLDQGCKSTKRLSCWHLESGEWWQYSP